MPCLHPLRPASVLPPLQHFRLRLLA